MRPPKSPASPAAAEAEDATAALHRMLAGNDPVASLRSSPRSSSAAPAVVVEAAGEAEDATAALHRMLAANDPVANLRAAASVSPKRASSSAGRRRPISPLRLPNEPATKGMLSAAVRFDDDDDDSAILEDSIAEDSFDRHRRDNPLDESTMIASDAEEPWAGAFQGRKSGGGGSRHQQHQQQRPQQQEQQRPQTRAGAGWGQQRTQHHHQHQQQQQHTAAYFSSSPRGGGGDSSADEILTEGRPTPRRFEKNPGRGMEVHYTTLLRIHKAA